MNFSVYNRFNTMCFQGHTAYFNPTTGNHDLVQTNTGHWGAFSPSHEMRHFELMRDSQMRSPRRFLLVKNRV